LDRAVKPLHGIRAPSGPKVCDHVLDGSRLTVWFVPRNRSGWPDRARLIAAVLREMAAA
jgi:hypothetical protein